MRGKGTVPYQMMIVLTITATVLAADVGQAAGPADTDWMSYNGTVNGQRYSPLDQITVANVASLTEVCRLQVDDSGTFQTGFLQIDGTLYLTTAHDTLAVDATNCTLRWRNIYRSDEMASLGFAYAGVGGAGGKSG